MDPDYGRNRSSIANFEERLNDLIGSLPDATTKPDGTIVVPSKRLQDVIDHFRDDDGMPILSEDEQATLFNIISLDPSLEISATMLTPLAIIAEKKKEEARNVEKYDDDDDDFIRGRRIESPGDDQDYNGRSSSNDSTGTRRNTSRPSSRGPGSVPQTPRVPSVFDSSRRQRATPLSNNPPSSYAKRPPAPSRRKSDAGSRSDSESHSSPSVYGYRNAAPRNRAPSNPTSPRMGGDFSDVLGSPTFRPPSRPASRNQGLRFGDSPPNERGYSSPDDTILSPSGFAHSISSLPIPRYHDDSDSDEDESALGLVMERQSTASTVSMEPFDRVEVLQRTNDELRKKLMEAETTLQKRLEEHEVELEDLTMKIDELTTELHATKKEEKELRSKERTNSNQISTLENEIGKLNRQLDHARTTYQSLQRQYQEQCMASEKYRDDLRRRDEAIRNLTDTASMHESEQIKWNRERDSYEDRVLRLEEELLTAQTAHASLDEQKQENLMLKETIDRLRFDMDELRNSYSSSVGSGSGASSRTNTVSKSLGAELAGKFGWEEEDSGEREDVDDEGEEGGSETVVEDAMDSDGEDVIQTIIRRRRKVPSKANRVETSQTFEETKEYSDSSTQYDPDMFLVGSSAQTDPEPLPPPRVIMAVQTEPPPTKYSVNIGTDPVDEDTEEERVLVEMEIQTEPEPSTSATTSETITPTSATIPLPTDSPPAYNQVAYEREIQSRVTAELRKLHPSHEGFGERVVNEGLLEEWQAFKDELGLECGVIDETLEKAKVIPRRREEGVENGGKKRVYPGSRFGGRFYRNIYNTYVYGSPEGRAPSSSSQDGPSTSALITQGAMIAGASALVIGASALVQMAFANSGFGPQYTLGVVGGPTYHDRVAWAGFNAMPGAAEGFAYYGGGYHGGGGGDGAFWNFLGRATERAARAAAGWPT